MVVTGDQNQVANLATLPKPTVSLPTQPPRRATLNDPSNVTRHAAIASPPTFSASLPAPPSTPARHWTRSPAYPSSSNAVSPPRHVLATRGGASAMIAGGWVA
jgi:hypothetical protein